MPGIAILIAAASLGVDYGWRKTQDGQLEYIIQIEPGLLETIRGGEEITSEIHPDAAGVRRFCIRVGSGALPREVAAKPKSGGGIASPTSKPTFDLPKTPPPDVQPPRQSQTPAVQPPLQKQKPAVQRPLQSQPLVVEPPLQNQTLVAEPPLQNQTPALLAPPAADRSSNWLPFDTRDIERAADSPIRDWARDSGFAETRPSGGQPQPLSEKRLEAPQENSPAGYLQQSTLQQTPLQQTPPEHAAEAQRQPDADPASMSVGDDAVPPASAAEPRVQEEDKPWLPLTLATLCLFASLGGNIYLGWIAWGFYWRQRNLAEQLRGVSPNAI